jgi:hypothetical protein
MLERVHSRLSFSNVVSLLALFIALGGGAYAAVKLPKNSVTTVQVKNGSLLSKDFKKGQLKAGPAGAQGPKGDTGAQGPKGDQGAPGEPGQPGTPAGGQMTKLSYLADVASGSAEVYANSYFRITATCEADGPVPTIRPKVDHGGWVIEGASLSTTNTFYSHVPDTIAGSFTNIRSTTAPHEAGTLTFSAPGGSSVTTITYTIQQNFMGRDCAMLGNALTVG